MKTNSYYCSRQITVGQIIYGRILSATNNGIGITQNHIFFYSLSFFQCYDNKITRIVALSLFDSFIECFALAYGFLTLCFALSIVIVFPAIATVEDVALSRS